MLNISLKANAYQPFALNSTPLGSNKFGPVFSQTSTFTNEPKQIEIPKVPMPIIPNPTSLLINSNNSQQQNYANNSQQQNYTNNSQQQNYNQSYDNKIKVNQNNNDNFQHDDNQNYTQWTPNTISNPNSAMTNQNSQMIDHNSQMNNQNSQIVNQNTNNDNYNQNNTSNQISNQNPQQNQNQQNTKDPNNTKPLILGSSLHEEKHQKCITPPKGMNNYIKFTDPSEFGDFGSPSDLIPIAWFSVWNQLREPANGTMSVIHASSKKDKNENKNWRFVFKIEDSKETTYYAVVADSELDVKKHIGTDDLDDIKILFDLPELNKNDILKIPYQTEALLHNSPFIPNPQYDPDLDDIDIEELVHNELKKKSIQNIKKQIEELQKKQNKMDEHEKELGEEQERIEKEKEVIRLEKEQNVQKNNEIQQNITSIEQQDLEEGNHSDGQLLGTHQSSNQEHQDNQNHQNTNQEHNTQNTNEENHNYNQEHNTQNVNQENNNYSNEQNYNQEQNYNEQNYNQNQQNTNQEQNYNQNQQNTNQQQNYNKNQEQNQQNQINQFENVMNSMTNQQQNTLPLTLTTRNQIQQNNLPLTLTKNQNTQNNSQNNSQMNSQNNSQMNSQNIQQMNSLPMMLTTKISDPVFKPMDIKTFPISDLQKNVSYSNFEGNVSSSFDLPVNPRSIISVGSDGDLDY